MSWVQVSFLRLMYSSSHTSLLKVTDELARAAVRGTGIENWRELDVIDCTTARVAYTRDGGVVPFSSSAQR